MEAGVAAANRAGSSRRFCSSEDRLNIDWTPIGELRSNPRNARTHSKRQLRQIAASISQFGFLTPVIIDENKVVLAGHGRIEAARLEGLIQVPTICFDHLT